MRTTLFVAAVLMASFVALTPAASADSCASTIAQHTACTPVYALYCAMYAGKFVVSCEVGVVKYCVEWCPRDLDVVLP